MSDNALEKFFTERIDWDTSERKSIEQRAKGWKYFGIAGWTLATVAVITIIPLLALKEWVPIVVKVDRLTGSSEVQVGRQAVDMYSKDSEAMMTADLGRYVRAREGFTRGEAENNYATVWWMSSDTVRADFDAEFLEAKNPEALMARLSAKDSIRIINMSVSFLPTDSPKLRTAQVRFDKIRRVGALAPTTQRMISTISYTYDVANIPKKVDGLIVNPFGFQASTFRTDKETEERPLTKATVQEGVFKAPGAGGQ